MAVAADDVGVACAKRGSIGPYVDVVDGCPLPVWKLERVAVCCRSIVPRQLPDVRNVAACPLVVDVDV